MSNEKIKEVNINDSKINISDIVEIKEDDPVDDDNNEPQNTNKEENLDFLDAPEINYKQEDDVEGKRKRLNIISRYKNSQRFGAWLKKQGFNMSPKNLEDLSIDELETMINDIRFCIATKNTNSMYETGATKGILVAETLLRPVYKIDGLSEVLSKDPTYLDLVEEILLENQNQIYVKPQYRLLYCVLSSAYIVHTQHVMLEKLAQTDEGRKMIHDMATKLQNTKEKNNIYPNINIKSKKLEDNFVKKYSDLLE